ncbi:DinB family protein [Pseudophaeobacter flagellatus]|uniref:DinB family protein n=1 Tax=Pseudophaeobacter flagellatus TaxID=2899119 RepID=UPI001E4C5A91|nr:DinB family protein [Pseudophaeobacter flagellatus]MCD9147102.1 DinB family protein [Pseudophaeobacter flagellatus]
MPTKEYALTMARYNLWQNENLLSTADDLPGAEREKDRGAFFSSIQKTLSHLFWGDMIWMSRFAGTSAPKGGITETTDLITSWESYRADRKAFDERILKWAHEVAPEWFEGELTWFSGAIDREITKPKSLLVIQFFNHQTHHRGQVHAMLTSAGAKPGDTDVPFMPEQFLDM